MTRRDAHLMIPWEKKSMWLPSFIVHRWKVSIATSRPYEDKEASAVLVGMVRLRVLQQFVSDDARRV